MGKRKAVYFNARLEQKYTAFLVECTRREYLCL